MDHSVGCKLKLAAPTKKDFLEAVGVTSCPYKSDL